MPSIVDRVDLFTGKHWLCWDVGRLFSKVTLFSLPEVFWDIRERPSFEGDD